jgi:plastocyanin
VRSIAFLALLLLATPLATAADATIHVANYTFSPLRLEVAPGATVLVTNADSEPHAMKTSDGATTFVPAVEPGGNATFTAPTAPGEYPYYCPFHTSAQPDPGNPTFMHGVLVVLAANATTSSPAATTPGTTTATAATPTTSTPTHADPGFEAVALVVGALVAVLLLRRR